MNSTGPASGNLPLPSSILSIGGDPTVWGLRDTSADVAPKLKAGVPVALDVLTPLIGTFILAPRRAASIVLGGDALDPDGGFFYGAKLPVDTGGGWFYGASPVAHPHGGFFYGAKLAADPHGGFFYGTKLASPCLYLPNCTVAAPGSPGYVLSGSGANLEALQQAIMTAMGDGTLLTVDVSIGGIDGMVVVNGAELPFVVLVTAEPRAQ